MAIVGKSRTINFLILSIFMPTYIYISLQNIHGNFMQAITSPMQQLENSPH